MARNTYKTVTAHGLDNLENSIASSDKQISPPRSPTNRFNPSPAFFVPPATNSSKDVFGMSESEPSVAAPRVDLNPILGVNLLRKEVED